MKEVTLYTDGACSGNPGKGGFGLILSYNDTKKELSEAFLNTTNNRMELLAVIRGLEILKEACNVTVYSDSKYVIDSLNKKWVFNWCKSNWKMKDGKKRPNFDLWIKLLELLKMHNVKFIWIKGHANNEFNNRCDILATSAITDKPLQIDDGYIV